MEFVQEFLNSTAGAVISITVVLGGVVRIYRLTKRMDAAIGTDKEGRSLSERTQRIEHQLWPNGGSSLADTVNNLRSEMGQSRAELKLVHDLIVSLVASKDK